MKTPIVLFHPWILLDAPEKGFSMGRLILRPHRSSQQREAVSDLLPCMILPTTFVERKGVSSHASLPQTWPFRRSPSHPFLTSPCSKQEVIVGDASHMPWTHLHLIQYKELPGPLKSPGPVAFSALWAVRQEAGGWGGSGGQRSSLSTLLQPTSV